MAYASRSRMDCRSHLPPITPRVLRGGLVPVAVGGEDYIAGQLRDPGEPIVERSEHRGEQHAVRVAPHAVFLEKGASAGGGFEHALDAQLEEVRVRKSGAGPGVLAGGGEAAPRLEKRVVHGGGRRGERHRGRFSATVAASSLFAGSG